MAVELPSDLVMDVMRNGDPARINAARTRLQTESGVDRTAFSQLVDSAVVQTGSVPDHILNERNCMTDCRENRAHKDFERMVLRNLFESLLPKEETDAFGSGPSAGVWRSMAADQLAGLYAENGGFGIAKTLTAPEGRTSMRSEGQWPYFSLDAIGSFGS